LSGHGVGCDGRQPPCFINGAAHRLFQKGQDGLAAGSRVISRPRPGVGSRADTIGALQALDDQCIEDMRDGQVDRFFAEVAEPDE
jgi:hypothetical protein